MQVRLASDVATEVTRRAIEQGGSAAGVVNDALRRSFELDDAPPVPTPAVRTIAERARAERPFDAPAAVERAFVTPAPVGGRNARVLS